MLTADEWGGRSGEGFSSRREVTDEALRRALWDECMRLTGLDSYA